MNTTPPPPYGSGQAPHAGQHPPYPHGHLVAPRKSRAGLIVLGIIGSIVVAAMTLIAISDNAQKKANYLAFHGDAGLHARVDGKDVGALSRPRTSSVRMTQAEGVTTEALVVELKPHEHQIEILDAKGTVVESVKLTVPDRSYRGLYAVGKPNGYAVINVFYGSQGARTEITPMRASQPHVFVATPDAVAMDELDLSYVDQPFPKALYVKTSERPMLRRICSQDTQGQPTCL
jgi:hypothetical protein